VSFGVWIPIARGHASAPIRNCYDILDPILEAYVEQYRTPREIAASLKLPLELVQDIVNKVDRNEYKRQQAAPGLKVTTKAFGVGRRMPIAQRFSG